MSEFPECMKRRGGPEDEGSGQRGLETQMNGQRCHRIAGHGGICLFDRPAEFEPVREPSNFRTNSSLGQLTRSSVVMPRMVPNPAAEA